VISIPFVLLHVAVRGYRLGQRPAALGGPAKEIPAVEVQHLTAEVICLRMEDHYVRVHTPAGSRLVAGPFERVIAGLGEREGMRVHRSWWVSRAAVVGVETEGRNLKLRLSNDLRAPVSRASVAKLREVGWLPAEA
jgi:DNA-binding LytR/AlgR family response regulator